MAGTGKSVQGGSRNSDYFCSEACATDRPGARPSFEVADCDQGQFVNQTARCGVVGTREHLKP